jgi:hypothetical protein
MRHPTRLFRIRLLLLPILLASCTSYIPFTDRIADRYRLETKDRPLLQYFVSDEFLLRRDTTDESAHITAGGTIRYFRGRRVEELRIRKNTPGAVVSMLDGGLGISFVPGDDRSAVLFAPDPEGAGEEIPDGERPSRFAAPPQGGRSGPVPTGDRYVLQGDATHPIRYDGKLWTVHYDRRPYLLIRGRDVEDQETRVRTLPGRTVSGR